MALDNSLVLAFVQHISTKNLWGGLIINTSFISDFAHSSCSERWDVSFYGEKTEGAEMGRCEQETQKRGSWRMGRGTTVREE